eukprot:TRINITY_DN1256_c1_g1_i3.p1 TRINITY_DN1256_c1_g1~~TRINITY_DN1256_c1_g1_i3.p1  ORF type:complete len:437 (+),score=153.47 TRINITY_DN1256_c1_g1_i3:311-1621(+)
MVPEASSIFDQVGDTFNEQDLADIAEMEKAGTWDQDSDAQQSSSSTKEENKKGKGKSGKSLTGRQGKNNSSSSISYKEDKVVSDVSKAVLRTTNSSAAFASASSLSSRVIEEPDADTYPITVKVIQRPPSMVLYQARLKPPFRVKIIGNEDGKYNLTVIAKLYDHKLEMVTKGPRNTSLPLTHNMILVEGNDVTFKKMKVQVSNRKLDFFLQFEAWQDWSEKGDKKGTLVGVSHYHSIIPASHGSQLRDYCIEHEGLQLWNALGGQDFILWDNLKDNLVRHFVNTTHSQSRPITDNDVAFLKNRIIKIQHKFATDDGFDNSLEPNPVIKKRKTGNGQAAVMEMTQERKVQLQQELSSGEGDLLLSYETFNVFWKWFFFVEQSVGKISQLWCNQDETLIHGFIDRQQAHEMLIGDHVLTGNFIVRFSSKNNGWFALT